MKPALIGVLFAFTFGFLSASVAVAQHHGHDPGSVAFTWDRPCPGNPSSHSDYPWCKPGCAADHACRNSPRPSGQHDDDGVYCPRCGCMHHTAAQLYTKNCAMIDALQATYCVSTHYLVALRARNNSSYAFACGPAKNACSPCAPSVEYQRIGTLEGLRSELAALHDRCVSCR